MTRDEHWQRAAGTLISASEKTRSLHGFQQTAASHLDAADYALQQLVAELAHVMPVTIASRASNVHHLPPGLARNMRRAGNAVAA